MAWGKALKEDVSVSGPKNSSGFETAYGIGTGMQIGSSIAGAFIESDALKQRAKFQAQQFEFNMKIAELQAEDAIAQGDQEAAAHIRKARQVRGSQRAAMGASGTEVNSGSNLSVQSDTEDMGDIDAMTIKLNAARKAWGFKVDATNMFSQSVLGTAAAENSARTTLLTGGLKALGGGVRDYAVYRRLKDG